MPCSCAHLIIIAPNIKTRQALKQPWHIQHKHTHIRVASQTIIELTAQHDSRSSSYLASCHQSVYNRTLVTQLRKLQYSKIVYRKLRNLEISALQVFVRNNFGSYEGNTTVLLPNSCPTANRTHWYNPTESPEIALRYRLASNSISNELRPSQTDDIRSYRMRPSQSITDM